MVGEGGEGEREAAARGRFAFATVCLLAITLFADCGIGEYVIFYNAPSLLKTGANSVEIRHNPENDSPDVFFQGYAVYYRAYQDEAAASSDISSITSLANSSNPDPEIVLAKINNLQFQQVSGADAALLLKPSGSKATYTLTLLATSAGVDWTIKEEMDSSSTTIKRGVPTRTSFNSQYLVGDTDFKGTRDSPEQLFFVFFALAFGSKSSVEFFTSVPSLPSDAVILSYTPNF